jgi:TonB family protein
LVNTIIIAIKIDSDGKVIEANVISGHPLFRKISEETALKSRYLPSFLFGERVRVYSELAYTFDGNINSVNVKEFPVRFTKDKDVKFLPIINGRAIDLQKPIYPKEAKDFCVKGKVMVEVLIDEKGDVIEAEAISGDELLHNSAVEAVKNTKFRKIDDVPRVKERGIIVYNFDSLAPKCVDAGIVNKKALKIPEPKVANLNQPKHLQITKEEIVKVQIIIDMDGNVKNARAIYGNLLLRNACEVSAKNSKFPPTLIEGKRFLISAILVYKFKPDGTIEF